MWEWDPLLMRLSFCACVRARAATCILTRVRVCVKLFDQATDSACHARDQIEATAGPHSCMSRGC